MLESGAVPPRIREALKDVLNEDTKSKAIDTSMAFTLRMRGNSLAHPTGRLEELMTAAVERGNLTAEKVTEILDSKEVRVRYESNWSIEND